MKYFFLVLIVVFGGFIGFMFSKKYKQRFNFFQALILLCQKFDVEINFSRERLKNIFEGLDEKHKRNLYGLDVNFVSYLNKKTELNSDELFKNINFLKDSEKDVLFQFFKCLGRSDIDSQTKEIKNFQSRFETIANVAEVENKKYGKLSIKLGVIAGLFLVVILI